MRKLKIFTLNVMELYNLHKLPRNASNQTQIRKVKTLTPLKCWYRRNCIFLFRWLRRKGFGKKFEQFLHPRSQDTKKIIIGLSVVTWTNRVLRKRRPITSASDDVQTDILPQSQSSSYSLRDLFTASQN